MTQPLEGAILVRCGNCGTEGERIKWVQQFGWACAGCGFGIHGQQQTPQKDVTDHEPQLEMFE